MSKFGAFVRLRVQKPSLVTVFGGETSMDRIYAENRWLPYNLILFEVLDLGSVILYVGRNRNDRIVLS